MSSMNLGKMCIHLQEFFLLKCNENVVFFSKTTKNILENCPFCYFMFGGCPYFLSKAVDQVYINKLRSCSSKNRNTYNVYIYIYIYIHNTLLHSIILQKFLLFSLSGTRPLQINIQCDRYNIQYVISAEVLLYYNDKSIIWHIKMLIFIS